MTDRSKLKGKRVRITRRGSTYLGTVVRQSPYDTPGEFALILHLEDGNRTGFHLSSDSSVEILRPSGNQCPVSEGKHSWRVCGLDVIKGNLRRVRQCVWCGKEKTLPF